MTTETTSVQDFSTCCDGRVEMVNDRVLGIAREYLDVSLHDGKNSSGTLKSCILLH